MKNKNFLRELWYELVAVECTKMDNEEAEIVKRIVAAEEELRCGLTEEGQQLLERYSDYVADLHAIGLAKAFEKGVVFSARYERAVFGDFLSF